MRVIIGLLLLVAASFCVTLIPQPVTTSLEVVNPDGYFARHYFTDDKWTHELNFDPSGKLIRTRKAIPGYVSDTFIITTFGGNCDILSVERSDD